MFRMVTDVKEKSKTILMSGMKPADIAVITDKDSETGSIVMRTADIDNFEVMNLSRPGPNDCWGDCPVEVELLPPGTEITLRVL